MAKIRLQSVNKSVLGKGQKRKGLFIAKMTVKQPAFIVTYNGLMTALRNTEGILKHGTCPWAAHNMFW